MKTIKSCRRVDSFQSKSHSGGKKLDGEKMNWRVRNDGHKSSTIYFFSKMGKTDVFLINYVIFCEIWQQCRKCHRLPYFSVTLWQHRSNPSPSFDVGRHTRFVVVVGFVGRTDARCHGRALNEAKIKRSALCAI